MCRKYIGFPSPYGDMFFSICWMIATKTGFPVSVPLRGNVFLNYKRYCETVSLPEFPSPYGEMFFSILRNFCFLLPLPVSVPLRGNVFLNWKRKQVVVWEGIHGFPSPYGEMFFSINECSTSQEVSLQFPSPYGEMFFSILCLQTTGREGLQRRSAALTAAGFFLNLCASLVTLFFQPFPLQNTSFYLNSQIFQTSAENGCTSMVQAPISYSSPRYFAHFTVWGETPRRRS